MRMLSWNSIAYLLTTNPSFFFSSRRRHTRWTGDWSSDGAIPIHPSDGFELLTQREKQVLQLIAQGNSNKEIAAMLQLSVNTVSVHRANLMDALNIHRTAELVVFAIRKGLVTLP